MHGLEKTFLSARTYQCCSQGQNLKAKAGTLNAKAKAKAWTLKAKAEAKDWTLKAKAEAKAWTFKAKAKDTIFFPQ